MQALPANAAAAIASCLLDERDLAALCCTSRSWRSVIWEDTALWNTLLERRFGEARAGGPQGAAAAAPAREHFRQLAALKKPVVQISVVWLNGQYLQVVQDAGSSSGQAVRLNNVCWLELHGQILGVLPGRYCAAWRCRLQRHFRLDEAQLIAAQELPAAGAGAEAGVGQPGAAEGQVAATAPPPAVAVVNEDLLEHIADQVGEGWFELLGTPFEVAQPCAVSLRFQGFSGSWKSGIIFDSVRLRRLPPTPPAAHGQAGQLLFTAHGLAGQALPAAPLCGWAPA